MYRIGIDNQAGCGKGAGLTHYVKAFSERLRSLNNSDFKFSFYESKRYSDGNLNTPQRLIWENYEMLSMARIDQPDLLHAPAFSLPFRKICPYVLTVHDLIGVKFDNQKGWPSRFYWKTWLPNSITRADHVIAISEHTKKDIVECLGVDSSKIRVVYPSGYEGFRSDIDENTIAGIKRENGISSCYFLTVGSFEPRKNLKRVLEAFGNFLRLASADDMQLVLVGPQDFARGEHFRELCAQFGVNQSRILATGFVNHDTLNALYCGAEALIFMSLYEGFGLPLLEAMASGCPIIAANRTSLPEVAGDAALLVNPEDTEAIANAMQRLYTEPSLRDWLKKAGKRRMSDFSWEKCAQETVKVYDEVLG